MDTDTLQQHAEQLVALFDQIGPLARPGAFDRLAQLQLNISHLKALRHIAEQGELPMKDLATCLPMAPPSVTALVRRLEAGGLVERTRHAEDSRIWLLRLTDEGRRLGEEVRRQRTARMAHLLQGLSADEQRQLLGLFRKAIEEQAHGTSDRRAESAKNLP
jgi:DNA-binding MarR family transcriptional regulator